VPRGSGCYADRVPAKPLAPALLLATPQLEDPNFRRTVVLVAENDGDGSFGFVLNRDADRQVSEVCAELGVSWPGPPGAEASWGGPVREHSGWLLFGDPAPRERSDVREVADGLYFTSSLAVLRLLAEAPSPPADLRLLLGYAAWAPGQLEDELAVGAWMLAPLNRDAVFRMAPETIWGNVWLDLGINPATLVSAPGVH
jgi:putative transcriptional regulator